MANTWGESGTTWGQGDWGQQNVTTLYPSGYSITATLDDVTAFPEQGWGSDTWGAENWGESGLTIPVTGYSITATLGDLAYAGSIEGWGRDEWGYGNWGENTTTVRIDGLEMTGLIGGAGWGRSTWGNDAWGEESIVNIELGEPLTGQSMTGSLGTPTPNYDFIFTLSESLLGTLSRGSISINDGADHTQGLGTQLITGTLNSSGVDVADVVFGPSSFLATMSLGAAAAGDIQRVAVTGYSITGSLGTLGTIDDMSIGVSGYAITGSLGTFTITDMQIGLTGYSITASLASSNVSPLGYQDISITGNTSYSDVDITGNTSYTDVDVA